MRHDMRGTVAIVGVAESDLGATAAGLTPVDLMAQAVGRALADCGLTLADVDGVFAAATQLRTPTLSLCEYLQLRPAVHDASNVGGSSFLFHVAHAHAALQAGLCNVAVIAYGSTQRTAGRASLGATAPNPYETPFRPVLPASAYALAASRHMHEYGTRREDLAAVAVAARKWAQLNPAAWDRTALSIEDVLASRMVSAPLTVRDCCLVTDGGGAIVMTRADAARDRPKAAAYVLGHGGVLSHQSISHMPNLTTTSALESGRQAYAKAGLAPAQVDVLQVYDAFTINTILFLEDLGFCPKGEGGRFVADGHISPGGSLPTNTSGGGLSYCHPGMFGIFTLIEAVRQIRRDAGARQVPLCDVVLAHGNGGVLSSQSTVILGSEATL